MSRRNRTFRWSLATAGTMAALALLATWASVNVPGPTNYLELDNIPGIGANVGFDMSAGAMYDWANSGAVTGDCTRPAGGGSAIECNGTGGIFDGGVYNGTTTVPTSPSITASAAADNTIVAAEFRADPLSVDAAIYPHPLDPNIILDCGTGDPTVYTGQGSEVNGDNINTETYSTGSVPNKDEISNAYAVAHEDPPNPAVPSNDDVFEIFAGFERVVNNGDSHVDLEFLQQPVSLLPSAQNVCRGKLQGHRTFGDLLLSVDFTNGGDVGTPILHKWVCGDFPDQPFVGVCDPIAHPGKKISPHYDVVDDAMTLAAVQQRINGDAPVGCGGWACRNADGTQTSQINTDQLYEVGIDLAALGFEGCISTFLPHTRSSQSFTATLKDFEIIPFNTCRPSTNLTKMADKTTVTTGDTVTYTYTEENDGNVPLTNPSVEDDKCSPVTYDSGDDGNNILDPGETWTFTCTSGPITSNTTNTAIGHGTFTIFGEEKDVTWCANENSPPAATICDQDERAQATVTVLVPSTTLNKTASPSVVTTVTYSYTETNDGDVALAPPTPGDRSSLVTDAACVAGGGTVAYTSGDMNGNMILDTGETWSFSCTAVYNGTGTFANTAIGHGIDNLGRDVTVCPSGPEAGKFCDADETDSNSVTVSVSVDNGK